MWNQPGCPLVDEWIKKTCSACTVEYCSATGKDRKWMDLETIMLSKISEGEKDRYPMFSLIHRLYNR